MLNKIYIGAAVLTLLGAAWWRNDYLVTKVAEQKVTIAAKQAEVAQLNKDLTVQQKIAVDANSRLTNHLNRLQVAEDETNRLRKCTADGTCGLRIKTVCPRVSSVGEPSITDIRPADTELVPESRQAYFELRDGIDQVTELLTSCIADVRSRKYCY